MVSFDIETIKLITYFEKKTRSKVKDCFNDQNQKLTFIVEAGELKKALGPNNKHVQDLEKGLDKKIRITEYSDDKMQFVRNLVAPLTLTDMEETPDGIIVLQGKDIKTNGLLIGKQARNLRNLEWMARRFFEIPEIKVVSGQ